MGLILMGEAVLSKSLILFSVDWWSCVPSLLFTWCQTMVEVMKMDLQKVLCRHCYTQCPRPCSSPPLNLSSTRDSWTHIGKSGSVSCGVTAPFSWVLVHTRFCLCLPRVCFQSCVSSGSSVVELMVTSSKRAYAIPRSAAPRAPTPATVHC